jgi:hypothetical protein
MAPRVLQDCVALVVCSSSLASKKSLQERLKAAGAKVAPRLNNATTHVVYHAPRSAATYDELLDLYQKVDKVRRQSGHPSRMIEAAIMPNLATIYLLPPVHTASKSLLAV